MIHGRSATLQRQSEKRKWKVKWKSGSLISRMKSEMKMLWYRDREWKVKWKCLKIEIESEKWNENASRSRSRSEKGKKFSRILEKRDSRWLLTDAHKTSYKGSGCSMLKYIVDYTSYTSNTSNTSITSLYDPLPHPLHKTIWKCKICLTKSFRIVRSGRSKVVLGKWSKLWQC